MSIATPSATPPPAAVGSPVRELTSDFGEIWFAFAVALGIAIVNLIAVLVVGTILPNPVGLLANACVINLAEILLTAFMAISTWRWRYEWDENGIREYKAFRGSKEVSWSEIATYSDEETGFGYTQLRDARDEVRLRVHWEKRGYKALREFLLERFGENERCFTYLTREQIDKVRLPVSLSLHQTNVDGLMWGAMGLMWLSMIWVLVIEISVMVRLVAIAFMMVGPSMMIQLRGRLGVRIGQRELTFRRLLVSRTIAIGEIARFETLVTDAGPFFRLFRTDGSIVYDEQITPSHKGFRAALTRAIEESCRARGIESSERIAPPPPPRIE